MPVEVRTRITLLLPRPETPTQLTLVDSAITDLCDFCGGVTASSKLFPAFKGIWINENGLIEDDNLLIFADAPVPLGDVDLSLWIENFKRRCQRDFSEDIIWITLHPVTRVTTDDFVK